MKLTDTLSLAYRTIFGNPLRTWITIIIIALGIAALVGINTARDALKQKFTESFSAMGANGFTIHYKNWFNFNEGVKAQKKSALKEKRSNTNEPITKLQAETFKSRYNFPATMAIGLMGVGDAVVSMGDRKTNPNIRVQGGDENFIDLNGFTLAAGRNLNPLDISSGRNVAIIGSDVAKKFFGSNPVFAVEKIIRVNNLPFRVIGVLGSKGSSLGMNYDQMILTSYNNVRRFFSQGSQASFNIQVKVADVKQIDGAIDQAEGIFRPVRRLDVTEADNFVIDKSDSIVNLLLRQLSYVTFAALAIGAITLGGAAIGLMNIMLVAVAERTKEIGLAKAIGARQRVVRQQFLWESVMISLMGAAIGVVAGVILGNVFSIVLSTSFVLPWIWLVVGIVICSAVGLLAGLYPAWKAGRLNPIEALRYE